MRKIIIFTVLFLAFVTNSFSSVDEHFSSFKSSFFQFSLTESEKKLIEDCKDNKIDSMTLFEAGLIVSGVNNKEDFIKYNSLFSQHISAINNLPDFNKKSDAEKTKIILEYIHQIIFKKYGFEKTTFINNLDNGEYNCLSSTVFFNAFCDKLGLKTGGTTGTIHAVSIVYTTEGEFLVETTNPKGVKPFTALLKKDRVIYSNIDLISSIWANRAGFIQKAGNNEDCIKLCYKALLMSPKNKEALQNFKTGFTQLGISFCQKLDYEKSISLTKEILTLFPDDKLFKENLISYVTLYITKNVIDKRYEKADELLKVYYKDYPNEQNFQALILQLINSNIKDLLQQKKFKEVVAFCEEKQKEYPKFTSIEAQLKYCYQEWSMFFINGKNWDEAIKVLDASLIRFPNDKNTINNLQYCKAMKNKK